MLQTLSLSNLVTKAGDVEGRIVVDITPEEKFGLTTIIEAMKHNKLLKVQYSIPTSEHPRTEFQIAPYCVRFWDRAWFLLGQEESTGNMLVFDLARVLSLDITDSHFIYNEKFTPSQFFKNYYGMDIDTSKKPVPIRLRVGGITRDMIRTLPLHTSQKELMAERDTSLFEYFFVPSEDFKKAVLSMGSDVEVLSPYDLREEVAETINRMSHKYNPCRN